jgi:hypothetical protein
MTSSPNPSWIRLPSLMDVCQPFLSTPIVGSGDSALNSCPLSRKPSVTETQGARKSS